MSIEAFFFSPSLIIQFPANNCFCIEKSMESYTTFYTLFIKSLVLFVPDSIDDIILKQWVKLFLITNVTIEPFGWTISTKVDSFEVIDVE